MKAHIELFQDAPHDGASPTVRLTWCLDREALNDVKAHYEDPHMLLVTVEKLGDGSFREVGRRVAPLSDGAAYPEFVRPGTFAVVPVIVRGGVSKHDLLKKKSGAYLDPIFRANGMLVDERIVGEQLNVEVPKEFFGRKPPRWVSWWVNFGYESPPKDQCAFRRRALLAFTLKAPAVLVVIAFLVSLMYAVNALMTMAVVVGLGFKKPNLSWVRDPFTSPDVIWEDSDDFIADCLFLKRPLLMLASPIFLTLAYLVSCLWVESGMHLYFIFGLIGLFAAVMLVSMLAVQAYGAWDNRERKKPEEAKGLEAVVCTGKRPVVAHRSVRLRYADLKSKICKPYAVGEGE